MEKNILDRINDYFEYMRESFGENILLDLDDIQSSSKEQNVKNVMKIDNSKTIERNELDKISMVKDISTEKNIELTVANDWQNSNSIDELHLKINNCMECKLGKTRKNFVFGSGNPNADIMVIGEAPGADEDEQGLPFVGRAGQLLTKILESISLSREEVYIANIAKCRPPNNRRPEKEETDKCEPYLLKQIELIKPEFILSLGLTSVDTLLKKTHKMADVRGKLLDYHGTKMIVTYHPAALLRNPNWKKFVWEDVKFLRRLYDEYLEKKAN